MSPDISIAEADHYYRSGKKYTHAVGLSCAFRQWRAVKSHCKFLHGYALQIELHFESDLDERGWVQDFGGLKDVKAWLEKTFDHKTIIASDDPLISMFREMEIAGACQLNILPAVGCEAFARLIFEQVRSMGYSTIVCAAVREHEANYAEYGRGNYNV